MTDPILSVIIPCYNSGQYLREALESVKSYPDKSVCEVIIVNDGSTDQLTLDLLARLPQEGYVVIDQENKGPAAARNTGVKVAKGNYILLLDSDNRVKHNYISKGIDILNTQPGMSVVYANPAFFGEISDGRLFQTGKFDMYKLLSGNYIDTCTIIRKSTWQAVDGQDESRIIMSHADWEFWIRLGGAGYQFYYLNEIGFDYRILRTSLVDEFSKPDGITPVLQYVYNKHATIFGNHYTGLYNQLCHFRNDQQRPFRSFLKFFYNKYLKKS